MPTVKGVNHVSPCTVAALSTWLSVEAVERDYVAPVRSLRCLRQKFTAVRLPKLRWGLLWLEL